MKSTMHTTLEEADLGQGILHEGHHHDTDWLGGNFFSQQVTWTCPHKSPSRDENKKSVKPPTRNWIFTKYPGKSPKSLKEKKHLAGNAIWLICFSMLGKSFKHIIPNDGLLNDYPWYNPLKDHLIQIQD